MKGTQIPNIKRYGNHSGLRTMEPAIGGHSDGCNGPGTVQLNIFSWNKKLIKYVNGGQPEKAIQLFQQMQQEGMSPDKFTFVQVHVLV
jgi:pentatricopeptide repeat protein